MRSNMVSEILPVILFVISMSYAKSAESNLPISREATFVESYSSSEVTIKATGMAKKEKLALIDMRKCAVYYVLFLGTDPILSDTESQSKFQSIEDSFFDQQHISTFVSWEANKVNSMVKSRLPSGKKGYKLTKMVRVNKMLIVDELTSKGVIVSRTELAESVGLPFIMVIPETPQNQTPLQVFDTNPYAKHAAAVIESYLTARKYDVVVPRASEQIKTMTEFQSQTKDIEEDISYLIAQAIGSDVYIVFSGTVQGSKASVAVKAYETTTARLLGTETGYSKNRPGVKGEVLVEEAISDAIDKVLSRVSSYWMDDVKNGVQYKVIFKFADDLSEDRIEDIQDAISELVDNTFSRSKENIVSKNTMDFLVWGKGEQFDKSSKIYRFLKSELASVAGIQRVNINRKLLILSVQNQ